MFCTNPNCGILISSVEKAPKSAFRQKETAAGKSDSAQPGNSSLRTADLQMREQKTITEGSTETEETEEKMPEQEEGIREKLVLTTFIQVLSFLIPAFGLLVFAIHCADSPKSASKCGELAIWGIVITIVIAAFVLLSGEL